MQGNDLRDLDQRLSQPLHIFRADSLAQVRARGYGVLDLVQELNHQHVRKSPFEYCLNEPKGRSLRFPWMQQMADEEIGIDQDSRHRRLLGVSDDALFEERVYGRSDDFICNRVSLLFC